MTVSNQTQYVNLAGNGAAAQVFPFAFRCMNSAYLTVEFRSATAGVTLLALNVDYTLSLNPDQEANPGGNVTMTDAVLDAPTASTTVTIISAAPNTQQLDLPTGGAFPAASVEAQLDNLTQQVQQLRDALASALRARPGDTLAVLPLASDRANTLQGYDSNGAPLLYANATTIEFLTQVQAPFGTAALPGYSFAGRTSDGLYSPSANVVGASANGAEVFRWSAGQFSTVLGSVGAPARAYTGDLDTGEWSPGANLLAWSTGGVEGMRLSATQQLGVGGAFTALGKLHVREAASGGATPNASRDVLVLESASGGGLTIMSPATEQVGIAFGDEASSTVGQIRYDHATNALDFVVNASQRLVITSDGRIYGTALHNNAGSVTGTANQYIASGTYTPTLFNTTNVASSAADAFQWVRVGNVVTVSGNLDIDPTAASTQTVLGISLPIASSIAALTQVSGLGSRNTSTTANLTGAIVGDGTNDRAQFAFFNDTDTANRSFSVHFTYIVV